MDSDLQKDYRHYDWITEFVGNLKKELKATFKEEISVYFDIHPQDGLLKTHMIHMHPDSLEPF